jgi:hypothetical protein
MKARTSIPKLRAALDDKAGEVIFAAGKALYAMGDPQGREVLIEVLEGDQTLKSGIVSSSLRDANANGVGHKSQASGYTCATSPCYRMSVTIDGYVRTTDSASAMVQLLFDHVGAIRDLARPAVRCDHHCTGAGA